MVVAYLLAQLLPWARGKTGGLLVLGSANVDERSEHNSPSSESYVVSTDCGCPFCNQFARLLHEIRVSRTRRGPIREPGTHGRHSAARVPMSTPSAALVRPTSKNSSRGPAIPSHCPSSRSSWRPCRQPSLSPSRKPTSSRTR